MVEAIRDCEALVAAARAFTRMMWLSARRIDTRPICERMKWGGLRMSARQAGRLQLLG